MLASYFFYGFWDWRFLGLIVFSTLLDFTCGRVIHGSKNNSERKLWLWLSVAGNLGVLGFFKYFNFFAENLSALLAAAGFEAPPFVLTVLLPVGISFYTFQTMSYTIDIYQGRLQPTRDFLDFALFVSFFPQLVAGPIERARNLLPQISSARHFDRGQFYEGCWLIYWGLYKKVFVADNVAKIVDKVYGSLDSASGLHVLVATYAFAVQIYCDFSGYSDIARGAAKTLGFEISLNFDIPYAARSPQEFWRRWHISLSQWLRDYLYIPLGGSQQGKGRVFLSLMVVMALGGLWHGAQWHCVFWGIYHGLLLAGYRLAGGEMTGAESSPRARGSVMRNGFQSLLMFHFTCLGWMLFRAESVGRLSEAGAALFGWNGGWFTASALDDLYLLLLYSALVIVLQVFQYRSHNPLVSLGWKLPIRVALYVTMYLSLTLGGAYDGPQFIYFQF